jgi:hypothetical protein
MQYRLRTLPNVLALGPPVLAVVIAAYLASRQYPPRYDVREIHAAPPDGLGP